LTVQRATGYWLPAATSHPAQSTWRDWCVTLANLLCIPGLFLLWRRARPVAIIFMIWLLMFPPVYYLVAYNERYRVPILWASFLPAAYAIVSTLRWFRSHSPAVTLPQ
jgi:hypothetical protein